MYKLNYHKSGKLVDITKLGTNEFIPLDAGNRHFQEFLAWNKEQANPLILQDKSPDPISPEETKKEEDTNLLKSLKGKDKLTQDELEKALLAYINLNF